MSNRRLRTPARLLAPLLLMLLAAPPGVAQDPAPPILVPGPGFSGPTPQPDPVGTGFGADAKAIARWDVVPYQTFDCAFEIGVVAFHINGIDRVEFSLNGGPWAPVTEMTRNPRTNVVEYWAQLDCQGLPDGPVEIRAIAYPTVGIPRVLAGAINASGFGRGEHSLFLRSNGNGTLPVISRHVSSTGDDATGDGSVGKPFKTIMKAARAIQDAAGTGNADGGIIRLSAGEYELGRYSYGLMSTTVNGWLTIAPMEGIPREAVRIIRASSADGLRTKLVRLHKLTLMPATPNDQTIITSNGPLEDYVWIDNCDLNGPGRAVNSAWMLGFRGSYTTNSIIRNCRDGLVSAIVRGTTIQDIGSDALSGVGLAVDCQVKGIDASGTSFHADILQYYSAGVTENFIAYEVTAETKDGQGFFAGHSIALKDIAFINCTVNNQVAPQVMRVFQFGGPTDHLYVRNCTFTGPAAWRTDMAFTAKNVVIEDSRFIGNPMELPSPLSVAGVTYIPAPGS